MNLMITSMKSATKSTKKWCTLNNNENTVTKTDEAYSECSLHGRQSVTLGAGWGTNSSVATKTWGVLYFGTLKNNQLVTKIRHLCCLIQDTR